MYEKCRIYVIFQFYGENYEQRKRKHLWLSKKTFGLYGHSYTYHYNHCYLLGYISFPRKKEITIQESQYNFLTRNEIDGSDVNQHIKVYYDNKEIYDPYVIKITITNTGNQEITEEDFKNDKFEIFFSENTILYDASVSNAISPNIAEEILSKLDTKDNCLSIRPFLLNANESFTLSLITNQKSEIFYNFRIAGISNTKKETIIYIGKPFLFISGISILLSVSSVIVLPKTPKRKTHIILKSIMLVMATIILVLMFVFMDDFASYLIEPGNMHQFIFK